MTNSPRTYTMIALLAVSGCGDDSISGDSTSAETDGSTSATTSGSAGSTSSSSGSTSDSSTGDGSSSGVAESSSSSSDSSSDGGSSSSTTGDDGLSDDDIMRIHDAVDLSIGNGLATGYSIAIWRDGEIIYAEGFGTKDEAGTPVTTDTVFQIGSDTKKMAAVTVLQRVDAGELTLAQTVGELLPELDLVESPGHFDATTVHALLSHTSGLFDYTPWVDDPADDQLAGLVYGRFAENEYSMMPPAIAWNYSNPNFALAGLIAEEVAGEPWPQLVIDDVAVPLGMTQTWARRDDAIANADDIASGIGPIYPDGIDTFALLELFETFPLAPDWVTPTEQDDNAFVRPAGLVWSTASDMATLGGFVLEGDPAVLSAESHEALRTPTVPLYPGLDPNEFGYAYGLMTQQGFVGEDDLFYDVPLLFHGGNTLSMTSSFVLLPDQGVAVSILANGYAENTALVEAATLEVAAGDALPPPSEPGPVLAPPRDDLSVYAGSFYDHALGDITLSFDGTDVLIDVPSLTMLGYDVQPQLLAVGRDVFLLDIEGAQLDISFYDGEVPFEFGVNRNFVLRRGEQMMESPAPIDAARLHAWFAHARAQPSILQRLLQR